MVLILSTEITGGLELARHEEEALAGRHGEAMASAYSILVAIGEATGAKKLIPIKWAHVSGVNYNTIGDAGVQFDEKRIDALKDTPTSHEQGIKASAATVRGFAVLKGVPEDHVKKLEEGMVKTIVGRGLFDFGDRDGARRIALGERHAAIPVVGHDELATLAEEGGEPAGINLLDTANVYSTGKSEEMIGEALEGARLGAEVRRAFESQRWRLRRSGWRVRRTSSWKRGSERSGSSSGSMSTPGTVSARRSTAAVSTRIACSCSPSVTR